MFQSSGLITSPIRTSAVMLCVPSLTSPSIAVCEWQSMMPGVTCLPAPSTTRAPAGGGIEPPALTIFPPTARRSPFSIVPDGPIVQSVAPRTSTAGGVAGAWVPSIHADTDVSSSAPPEGAGLPVGLSVLVSATGEADDAAASDAGVKARNAALARSTHAVPTAEIRPSSLTIRPAIGSVRSAGEVSAGVARARAARCAGKFRRAPVCGSLTACSLPASPFAFPRERSSPRSVP